jgi:hypothetical protein
VSRSSLGRFMTQTLAPALAPHGFVKKGSVFRSGPLDGIIMDISYFSRVRGARDYTFALDIDYVVDEWSDFVSNTQPDRRDGLQAAAESHFVQKSGYFSLRLDQPGGPRRSYWSFNDSPEEVDLFVNSVVRIASMAPQCLSKAWLFDELYSGCPSFAGWLRLAPWPLLAVMDANRGEWPAVEEDLQRMTGHVRGKIIGWLRDKHGYAASPATN